MKIALISHDAKKELMVQFCIAYYGILSKHELCATEKTGNTICNSTDLKISKLLPGCEGGVQQIASRVTCNEIDLLLFFRDPLKTGMQNPSDVNLLRVCDMHNISYATNIATAEILIHGLKRGDLDWRNVVNDSKQ